MPKQKYPIAGRGFPPADFGNMCISAGPPTRRLGKTFESLHGDNLYPALRIHAGFGGHVLFLRSWESLKQIMKAICFHFECESTECVLFLFRIWFDYLFNWFGFCSEGVHWISGASKSLWAMQEMCQMLSEALWSKSVLLTLNAVFMATVIKCNHLWWQSPLRWNSA